MTQIQLMEVVGSYRIIRELSDFDLVSSPRLVRLNPNVPWKTRGNGAVAFTFGRGNGQKKKIGQFGDEKFSLLVKD